MVHFNKKDRERYCGSRSHSPILLRGRIGISILETIRNTPKPDDTELEERVKKLEETIKKAKEDGFYDPIDFYC